MRHLNRIVAVVLICAVLCGTTVFADNASTSETGKSNTQIAIDAAGEVAEKTLDGLYNYNAGEATPKTDKAVKDALPEEDALNSFFEQVSIKGQELSDNFFGAFFSESLGVEKVPLSKFVVSLVQFLVLVVLQLLSLIWRVLKAVIEALTASIAPPQGNGLA